MSSIRAERLTGDADPSRVRMAGWLDLLAALLITMLAWPFPVLRASLPWAVHGPLIVVAVLVADIVLRTTSLLVWGRTTVMYLLDLGLVAGEERIDFLKAAAWSVGWTVASIPALMGVRTLADPLHGLPARLSGLVTRSTA